MTVDACHSRVMQQSVSRTSALARGVDNAGVMATSTGHAILPPHLFANLTREFDPARLPNCGIAEIIGMLSNNIFDSLGDVGIGFDEPVRHRNVTLTTARHDAGGVGAVSRMLKARIGGKRRHRVTGSAEGVGCRVAIDSDACNDCGASQYAADN